MITFNWPGQLFFADLTTNWQCHNPGNTISTSSLRTEWEERVITGALSLATHLT